MSDHRDILSWHPVEDVAAIARSRSAAGKALRFCVPALLSSALLWPMQPGLADFVQSGPKLFGTGAGGNAQQGASVALSADGHTAIVGGPFDNNNAGGGAAWVFTRSGGVWNQQGIKLVGSGAVGTTVQQGFSVALSADGNTAILGGAGDNNSAGAAWVFTRSSGVWSQQGDKLVGTGAVGSAFQGFSVALSADGNTAIVGGSGDNSQFGAAWVFTRSGGVWSQQGNKLVGTGAVGTTVQQGISVALSADGNTAIVGGNCDNSCVGAAWVFTRSGGVWSQQGNKLVGTGAVGAASQGISVALSGDGNTAMVGGYSDNSQAGAAWVFTRSGGVWTPQGNKLVGTGAVGSAFQGFSVALSGGGNTAIVGGEADNNFAGAAWVFTRSGGVWTQQGNKLFGTGAIGNAEQGASVALSCNTAFVGGRFDNSQAGAAWVFVAPPTGTHDFGGDCLSDIVWRDTSGQLALWFMNGAAIASATGAGTVTTDWSVVGQRDFNGDGRTDILWRHTSGQVAIWLMNGATILSGGSPGTVTTDWSVAGTGDFNGNGFGDILWRNTTTGQVAIWLMNGTTISSGAGVATITTDWVIAGTGDFDGDGMSDILWRNTATGQAALWFMNGAAIASAAGIGTVTTDWIVAGTGDFNGDGKSDILWRNTTTGQVAMWFMSGTTLSGGGSAGSVPTTWTIAETGDFNSDGKSDLLWRDTSGNTAIWLMDGTTILPSSASLGNVPTSWTIQGVNAD
jgi:FG-GAP-like repeat